MYKQNIQLFWKISVQKTNFRQERSDKWNCNDAMHMNLGHLTWKTGKCKMHSNIETYANAWYSENWYKGLDINKWKTLTFHYQVYAVLL